MARRASAIRLNDLRTIALPWPPQERAQAVIDYAGRADHVLVAHHDDAEALTLTRAARIAAPQAYITVLMRDVRLAEDAGATLNEAKTRVLSQAAIAARALTIAHPPFLIAKDRKHERIHALIIGFGQTGQAIARDLIVNCRTTYLGLPHLTIIDPQAKALEGVMRVRTPEIDACADSRFIAGEIMTWPGRASGTRQDRRRDRRGRADHRRLRLPGHRRRRPLDRGHAAVAAALDRHRRPADLRAGAGNQHHSAPAVANRGLDALIPFGDLASILESSEFLSNAPDAAARAFNEAYRASLTPEQRSDPANRSANAWDELDETYRQANRDAVAHVPAKLASAGIVRARRWRWVTGTCPQLGPGEHVFTDDVQLELLAELEHERWLAQRRMDGWRWTERPSKNEARHFTVPGAL